jgi:hypothetical protein
MVLLLESSDNLTFATPNPEPRSLLHHVKWQTTPLLQDAALRWDHVSQLWMVQDMCYALAKPELRSCNVQWIPWYLGALVKPVRAKVPLLVY